MKTSNELILNRTPSSKLQPWVYAFILLHILVWTLAPTLIRHTLPMDALEGTIWGQQLEWGYDKNPFVNGWLTALGVYIGGQSGWAIYLLSQLSVGLCFWSVWQLGKRIMPPIYAFCAVLSLESMQYFNLHAIDLNDNTLELGLWGVTTLCFYQAIHHNTSRYWILTGLFAGLCMMTKYYAVMLLLPFFGILLAYPTLRALFRRYQIYLGLLAFLIVVTPHTIWLFFHNFVTVNYAMHRVSSEPTWWHHLTFPAHFVWQQVEVFLPTLFLLLLLLGKKSPEKSSMTSFDTIFLLAVGLGPFLLTTLLSMCTGIQLRAGWGQPLLTWWPFILLAVVKPAITRKRLITFVTASFILFTALVIGYSTSLIQAKKPSSANFPGKNIATELTQTWQEQFHTPLPYVVGARWLAGNIAFYSSDHPSVYMDANPDFSPWIDEEKLKKQGALFVWDPTENRQMTFSDMKKRFPKLQAAKVMHFPWLRNAKMAPVEISVAILPPE